MFCPNCGAQLPDGTQFCPECGMSMVTQSQPAASTIDLNKAGSSVPQPSQSFGAPTQPINQPVQPMQPTYPQQSFDAQQQQFGAQQPGYAAPVYGQQTAVKKKPPVVPIVIGVCAAAVVAFLIVLFTVIIPNNSGIRGKLRHKWSATESGITVIYDFKKNEVSSYGLSFPIEWEVKGEDRLKVEMSLLGQSQSDEYVFSISSDGRTLTLSDPDYPTQKTTWMRAD